MYTWNNIAYYRYAVGKGMEGNDVAVLQLNLGGIPVDGVFEELTNKAVKKWQTDHHLYVDGIAGNKTQQSIVVAKSNKARLKYNLPNGMIKSLLANESGFYLAAFSQHPSDWGYDLGAYQNSIGPEGNPDTQESITHSYKVTAMAEESAKDIKDAFIHLSSKPIVTQDLYDANFYKQTFAQGDNTKFAWCLAVLNHNWPTAAENLATVGSVFKDDSRDDKEEEWIVIASGGKLKTPKEWVIAYVQKSTIYVKWS